MVKNWIKRILQWVLGNPAPVSRPPLVVALEHYEQALSDIEDDSQALLPVLLARDQVEAAMQQTSPLPIEQAQQLLALDKQLRKGMHSSAQGGFSAWRRTFHPSEAHWWWFLDQAAEKREEERDLVWVLLAATFMTLTIPLALEIVKRLWAGAPDTLSVFGTLLTLLLTASPLTKRGRELAQWLLNRIPRLQRRFHAEAMAAMAGLAFVLVLAVRLSLPGLAVWYNDRGHEAVREGNLSQARQYFQRAVALDPDMAVGYYHLGAVYEEIGRPEEAVNWYQRALEYDLDLGPAYNNLGRLYILQGEPEKAVPVLQAGLKRTPGETETDLVTRYRLLSNLGWAHYLLEQPALARQALEEAVALESEMDVAFRSAVPHYYLALTYQALGDLEAARQQLEESLRYLDPDDPAQTGWDEEIYTHLQELEEAEP